MGRIACKVCDVRDAETALGCAEIGVAFVGLHCIWQVKPGRHSAFREIVERLAFHGSGTRAVIVTKVSTANGVVDLLEDLSADAVQLHSPEWTPSSLRKLRFLAEDRAQRSMTLLGVVTPSDSARRVEAICSAVDLVVIDQTYWQAPRQSGTLSPVEYRLPLDVIHREGKKAMIAGGLTPTTVASIVRDVRPDGVDVQRGVRAADKVDLGLVESFVRAVREAEETS